MTLKEKISSDFKTAFKSQEKEKAGVLRLVLNAFQQKEIELRGQTGHDENLSDEMVLGILQSEIKKRKDAAQQYQKGGRPELAQKEEAEIAIIKEYLPEQLSLEQIREKVKEAIKQTNASSSKDMGRVIGLVSSQAKGQAEGSVISLVAKEEIEKLNK